jgi:hypothetical protein
MTTHLADVWHCFVAEMSDEISTPSGNDANSVVRPAWDTSSVLNPTAAIKPLAVANTPRSEFWITKNFDSTSSRAVEITAETVNKLAYRFLRREQASVWRHWPIINWSKGTGFLSYQEPMNNAANIKFLSGASYWSVSEVSWAGIENFREEVQAVFFNGFSN